MYRLTSFRKCTQSYNHHQDQDTEHFPSHKKSPMTFCSQLIPRPWPLATSDQLSLLKVLPLPECPMHVWFLLLSTIPLGFFHMWHVSG